MQFWVYLQLSPKFAFITSNTIHNPRNIPKVYFKLFFKCTWSAFANIVVSSKCCGKYFITFKRSIIACEYPNLLARYLCKTTFNYLYFTMRIANKTALCKLFCQHNTYEVRMINIGMFIP